MSEYGALVHAVNDIGNCATMTLNSSGISHTNGVSHVDVKNHTDVVGVAGECTTTMVVPLKYNKHEGKIENGDNAIEWEPKDNKETLITVNGQIKVGVTEEIGECTDYVQGSDEQHVNDSVATTTKDVSLSTAKTETSTCSAHKSDESCKLNSSSSEISVQHNDVGGSEGKNDSGNDRLCASPTDGQPPHDNEASNGVECMGRISPTTDNSIHDAVPTDGENTSRMEEGTSCREDLNVSPVETADTVSQETPSVSGTSTSSEVVSGTSTSSEVALTDTQTMESEGGESTKDTIGLETADIHKEKVDEGSPSISIKSKDGSQISLLKFNPGLPSSGRESKSSETQSKHDSTNDKCKVSELTEKEMRENSSSILNENAIPNSNGDEQDVDLSDTRGNDGDSTMGSGLLMEVEVEEKTVGFDTIDGGSGVQDEEKDDVNSIDNERGNENVSVTSVENCEGLQGGESVDGLEKVTEINMDGVEANTTCGEMVGVSSEDVDMNCDVGNEATGKDQDVSESSCHDTGASSGCADSEGGLAMKGSPGSVEKDQKEGTLKPEDDSVNKEENIDVDLICVTADKVELNNEDAKNEVKEENVHLKIDGKGIDAEETKSITVKLEELKTEDLTSISETPIKSFNDKDKAPKEEQIPVSGKLSVDNSKPMTEQVNFKDILKMKPDGLKLKPVKSTADSGSEDDAIVIEENENDVEINSRKPSDLSSSSEGNVNNNSNSNDDSGQEKFSTSEENKITVQQEGRKRSISSFEDLSPNSPAKRSRLDSVVNKLEGHLGSKNASDEVTVVLMDSDDDEAVKKTPKDTTVLPVSQEEEKPEEKPGMTMTSAALRNLIFATIKTVIQTHKLEKTRQFEERMSKMESANTLWMGSAKHLEKSVDELTKFSKEIDKRKSQSQKLKHLSSRNVAIQVTIPIPNHPAQVPRPSQQSMKAADQPPKQTSTPRSQQQRSHSATLKLPPSMLLNHNQQRQGTTPVQGTAQHSPVVRQTMATTQQRPAGMPPQSFSPQNMDQNRIRPQRSPQNWPPSKPPPTYQQTRTPGVNQPPPQARPNVVRQPVENLIDLTDEDDTSKKTPGPPQSKQNPSNIRTQVPHRNSQASSQGGRIVPPISNNAPQHTSPAASRLEGNKKANSFSSNSSPTVRQGAPVQYVQKSGVPGNVGRVGVGAPRHLMTSGGVSIRAPSSSLPTLPPSVHNMKHPAPFPTETNTVVVPVSAKFIPSKPSLKISRVVKGIVLSWNMPQSNNVEVIASYQLFAYQESSTVPNPSSWKKVGDVKALPLPMACTLTQFQEGNKYYFAVRAVDQYGRWGEYSDPSSIYLYPEGANSGGTRES